MTTEQWATSARENLHWQKPAEQKAITTFHDLLEHRIGPLQAAQTITSIYVGHIEEGDVNSWLPWTILLDAIKSIHTDTVKLHLAAKMVRSMSQLPEPLDNSGQSVKSDVNGQVFWRDVPGFAHAFRQASPFVQVENLGQDLKSEAWKIASKKVMNINIFAAFYLRELDPNGPERDFASMRKFAQDQLRWTLEIKTETSGQVRRAELYVPAVVSWIQVAAGNIFKYCEANRDSPDEDVPQRWMGGPQQGSELLWTGRDGFSAERWTFWKKRFGELAALSGASETVRTLAGQAAKEMEKNSRIDEAMT